MYVAIISPLLLVSCQKDGNSLQTVVPTPNFQSSNSSFVGTNMSTALGSDLMFYSSFEAANSISTKANSTSVFCNIEEPYASSITQSDSTANGGHYSMKMVLNVNDPLVNGGKRAEVSFAPDPVVKVERWIGVSMKLPASYITDPEPESVLQYHDIPDLAQGGTWRSPPFALETVNGKWVLIRRWSATKLSTTATDSEQDYDLGWYDKTVWTNWVFHIKFAWDSTGLIEVWKNGKLVLTVNGPNAFNDIQGNYLKVGIYKWAWDPQYFDGKSTCKQREIFIDALRIGNENASYNAVTPYNY
jgi:hypothetical protein